MALTDKEGQWNRDGNLIYSVTEDGFRGREMRYRNRIAINVTFDRNVTPQEQEQVIEVLLGCTQRLDDVRKLFE